MPRPMDTITHPCRAALLARLIAGGRNGRSAARLTQPAAGRYAAPWDGRPGAPAPWAQRGGGRGRRGIPRIDIVAQAFGDIAYLTQHRGVTPLGADAAAVGAGAGLAAVGNVSH